MAKTSKGTKPKKRNPQDATLRNIRALKKKVELLEADNTLLWVEINQMKHRLPSIN